MENNTYERKHFRGSSPDQEMKKVFNNWVKRLRSIEVAPESSLIHPAVVEERKASE